MREPFLRPIQHETPKENWSDCAPNRSDARFRVDRRLSVPGRVANFNRRSRFLLTRRKMNIILSAVLPAAAGLICVVDDDPSMLKPLNRLLFSVDLQARLLCYPFAFLTSVIWNIML